ncbi:MAG: glycosyltransferase family 4 protein [Candidatus Helarchaeota archaeon]
MRVIRVIPHFYPLISGPANQAFHISNELEKNNINSPILTSDFGYKNTKPIEKFGNVICLRFKSLFNIFQYSFTPHLISYLYNAHFDLLHAHSYRNFQADVSFLISKLKRIPFIINTHGTATAYLHFKRGQIFTAPYKIYDLSTFKSILRKASIVIAATKQEFNDLLQFNINKEKIFIIPAGINIRFPERKDSSSLDGNLRLLYVGRISRNRRIEIVLQAFKILYKTIKNISLWIIGGEERSSYIQQSGYLKELMIYCKKYHLDRHVHFIGYLPQRKLIPYYLQSDIFIYTSDYENFGQTILEAAAAGLPLICSAVGIANDIIDDGKNGFIVPNDPHYIATKLRFLIENEKNRKRFGILTKKKVKNNYSWDKVVKKYIKIYNMLL